MNPVSSIRDIAAQALKEASQARDTSGRREVGDKYLGTIVADAQATSLEKLVAATAKETTALRLGSSSATGAQQVALQALAAGVGGPLGQTLAALGEKVMGRAYDQEDSRAMGRTWLAAVEKNGDPAETTLARTAHAVADLRSANSTAVNAERKALQMLAAGQHSLAAFGTGAMRGAYDLEDSRAIGRTVLPAIEKAASDPLVAALASVAGTAANLRASNSSARNLQGAALELLAAPPTTEPGKLLAHLGKKARSGAYDLEDARAMSAAVLAGMVQHAKDPVEVRVAEAAVEISRARMSNSSAVNAQVGAFDLVDGGVAGVTPEVALARLAKAAKKGAYDTEDADTSGRILLQHIEMHAADPTAKSVAATVTGMCSGLSHSEASKLQQDTFDSIIAGSPKVPAPPVPKPTPRGTPRLLKPIVQLPPAAEVKDPDAELAALEDVVAKNRAIQAECDQIASDANAESAELQKQLQSLSTTASAPSASLQAAEAEVRQLKRIATLGGMATWGGVLTSAFTGSPIGLVVAGVGAAVYIGATLKSAAAQRRRMQANMQGSSIYIQQAEILLKMSLCSSRSSDAHATSAAAEEVIQAARGRIDVMRMANAVNGQHADPNAKVALEEDFVVIGGLRVPRSK